MTTEAEVRGNIIRAFSKAPYPGSNAHDISSTTEDEGIVDYFGGTTWKNHDPAKLRFHSCALSFFTPAAYRYWLPAFMLAEIDDPETADVIAEHIAGDLADLDSRICAFNTCELEAVIEFLKFCQDRYGNMYPFAKAIRKIYGYMQDQSDA